MPNAIVLLSSFSVQLQTLLNDMEQEKVKLQRQHSQNIKKMLDETSTKLEKMEEEYKKQINGNVSRFFC